MHRCFVDTEAFSVGEVLSIEDTEFHHLRDVVRAQCDDMVELVNGWGWLAIAQIVAVDRRRCQVVIREQEQKERPSTTTCLALAFLRPGHLDIALEKGTEVGVDQFVIFTADKSERHGVTPSLQRRSEALITAAVKQSGRLFRPALTFVGSLEEALSCIPAPQLYADLDAKQTCLKCLETLPASKTISVLVGPESGWSSREKELLREKCLPVLLHTNVLRAETAGIVAAYLAACRPIEL